MTRFALVATASGWMVYVTVAWAMSRVHGLARDLPFVTEQAARAWITEQFGTAAVVR